MGGPLLDIFVITSLELGKALMTMQKFWPDRVFLFPVFSLKLVNILLQLFICFVTANDSE